MKRGFASAIGLHYHSSDRERKMRTKFFCTNFLNIARGAGHPGKIPGTSRIPLFETQGRQSFQGGHEVFGHHPFAWKTPTPPGGLRTQKLNLCALFSCLNSDWKLMPIYFWNKLPELQLHNLYLFQTIDNCNCILKRVSQQSAATCDSWALLRNPQPVQLVWKVLAVHLQLVPQYALYL